MTEKFIPKRPHKKSRAGCVTCKTKKVKCDEVQPVCSYCLSRRLNCYYATPPSRSKPSYELVAVVKDESPLSSSSSSTSGDDDLERSFRSWDLMGLMPPVISSSGTLSARDVEMIRHFTTTTWGTLGVGNPGIKTVFDQSLPVLAIENDFLLSGVLGIASLHMQHMLPDPSQVRNETAIYRAKAFSQFRQAVVRMETQSSWEAGLLMALLLVVLCSQDYLEDTNEITILNWLVLYGGLRTVIYQRGPQAVSKSRVGPVFERHLSELKATPAIPSILLKMMASVSAADPDFPSIECYCQTLDTLAMLFASLRQDGLSPPLYLRVVSWPSFNPDGFTTLAQARRPRALVIIAYYLSFLKLIQGVWWVQGISNQEIRNISLLLAPEWHPYMALPLQIAKTEDAGEIRRLLLG